MKAGIITHYDVHNHGAHLQLYALAKQLKDFGYEAKALRYHKNYDFLSGSNIETKYQISIRSVPIYIKYLFSNGLARTIFNYKKRKTLIKFRNDESLIGEYYSQAKDLDVVIIGSDEIFSIEAGLNPCFWGMGIPCKNTISYAASFGPITIDFIKKHNAENFVEAGIKNIGLIAVRDRNSMEIVKYYSGKEVPIVCDPVLIYEFSQQINEEEIKKFYNSQKKKYCIVYSYDYNMNDEMTVKAIRDYANKRRLKVYSIAYFHKWCDKNIELSPIDLFKWFSCAEIVFTDTFHGSVISLATRTQFISKIRGNGNKLAFLLDQYNVSERKVEDFSSIEQVVKKEIDYTEVGRVIKRIRSDSITYLKSALKHNQ